MVLVRIFLAAVYMAAYATAAVLEIEPRVPVSIITKCTVSNRAALTFDDGPHIYTKAVVDTLVKNSAKGTFFLNGNNFGCIYDKKSTVKYAYDKGMQIASHTWAHKNLATLTRAQITSEMSKTEEAIERITGARVAFTRPPYGSYNTLVRTIAGERGQKLINWDFDSQDSSGASVQRQKQLYDQIASRRPSNILSLQHDVKSTTAYEVLPHAIKRLKAAGYKLVTVAECLNTAPYKSVKKPASGNFKC